MGLENPTYINDMNEANPLSNDPFKQGDDHIRNMKGAIKRSFTGHAGAVELYGEDTTNTNSYAINPSPAITSYSDGLLVKLVVSNTNTGAVTLNVNGLGAKPVYTPAGADFISGAFRAGRIHTLIYKSGVFISVGHGAQFVPGKANTIATLNSDGTLAAAEVTYKELVGIYKVNRVALSRDLKLYSTSASTVVTIQSGVVLGIDTVNQRKTMDVSGLTVDLSKEWGVDPSPANGRANGIGLASGTWFYLWAIGDDSGNVATLAHTSHIYSVVAADVPSGYSYKGLFGACYYINSTSNIRRFVQYGNKASQESVYAGYVTGGTSSTLYLSDECPAAAVEAVGHVKLTESSGSAGVRATTLELPGTAFIYQQISGYIPAGNSIMVPFTYNNYNNTIDIYAASGATTYVYIDGYTF